LAAREQPCESVEPNGPVERTQRYRQVRVELVQVPAQPLLSPPPLIHQVVAVIDQQLQLVQHLLARPRPVQTRLLQRGPRNRERVDLIRLAAGTATPPLRRRQPRRHPHQPLTGSNQRLLQTARDVPTVLDRPQPLLAQRASPLDQLRIDRAACLGEAAAKLVDGDRGQRVLVYVQPNNDHPTRLLPLETTVERTDLNRGKLPSSYQVTLGGLREGGGDITLDSQLQGATFRNRVSRRQPELSNSNQTA